MNLLLAAVPAATPVPYQDIHTVLYWAPMIGSIVTVAGIAAQFLIVRITYFKAVKFAQLHVKQLEVLEDFTSEFAALHFAIRNLPKFGPNAMENFPDQHKAVVDKVMKLWNDCVSRQFYLPEKLYEQMRVALDLLHKLAISSEMVHDMKAAQEDWRPFYKEGNDTLEKIDAVIKEINRIGRKITGA